MARRARRAEKGTARTQPTRKHLARREREAIQVRRIWVALTLVGIALIGVLGFGAYQEFLVKPNVPVAIVNGVPIRAPAYQSMVRYQQWQLEIQAAELQQRLVRLEPEAEDQEFMAQYLEQQVQQIQAMMSQLPMQTVESMIGDELVRQEALRRGITVSDEELEQTIEEQFGYYRIPPTSALTPTPAADTLSIPTPVQVTLEEYQESYANFVKRIGERAGMSERELREVFRDGLLRDKLQELLAAEVPTAAEQVRARHILVETEEEAQQVSKRLNEGEPFELLAQELSTDESNKDEGGDLGWFPKGQMVSSFEEAAFNGQVGELVGPVQTSFGWHIIKIEGHEVRELEPAALRIRQSRALENWLAEARLAEAIENLWRPEMAPPAEEAQPWPR